MQFQIIEITKEAILKKTSLFILICSRSNDRTVFKMIVESNCAIVIATLSGGLKYRASFSTNKKQNKISGTFYARFSFPRFEQVTYNC